MDDRRFVENVAEKLILLQRATGGCLAYRLVPPIPTQSYDYVSIQTVARQIAELIGLGTMMFVIGVTKQEENASGHIELRLHENEVFIEISAEIMELPETATAVLCHELSHKWLQMHGIRSEITMDNEILTDIAAVFLGLGKMMLNGCKVNNERFEKTRTGTNTIRETIQVGYLDQHQLAFVYRVVCAMRGIPPAEYCSNLDPEALKAIKQCDLRFGQFYDDKFRHSDAALAKFDKFSVSTLELQRILAELEKKLKFIRLACCDTVDSFIAKEHEKLEFLRQQAVDLSQLPVPDRSLSFLQNIESECKLTRMAEEIRELHSKATEYLGDINLMGKHLSLKKERFPTPSPSVFRLVSCRRDGTKLRLPENSGDILVTCPTCKSRFGYNTSIPSFNGVGQFSEKGLPKKLRCILGL